MKEQIENLISKWSDDAEFYMTQQQKSELAERLDKAIGIDSEKVKDVIGMSDCEYWKYKPCKLDNLVDEITQSRPLKCEVEEKWNDNVEECSECGIKWKKIGKSCPVCFAPAEKKLV